MRTKVAFCDLCAHDGEIHLAKGFYITDECVSRDVCAMHLKEVTKYGFKVIEYYILGDVDEDLFQA